MLSEVDKDILYKYPFEDSDNFNQVATGSVLYKEIQSNFKKLGIDMTSLHRFMGTSKWNHY